MPGNDERGSASDVANKCTSTGCQKDGEDLAQAVTTKGLEEQELKVPPMVGVKAEGEHRRFHTPSFLMLVAP